MKKLFKEPLFQFFLIGAGIFALEGWRANSKPVDAAPNRIVVSAGTIAWLSEGFARQWHRGPDADEMRGLVNDHIREEILYREALALGLDRDDTIVRRRMAQKMDFLTQDLAMAVEPDETALRAYFAANAARYASPIRMSLHHVYFSKERRGSKLESDAREFLEALRGGADEESIGDPFLGEHEFESVDVQDITAALGAEFAAAVASLPVGEWLGPVPSSYGVHLVRVTGREEPQPGAFETTRDAVARDLAEERRSTANREFIEKLEERYQISVDEAAFEAAIGSPPRTVQR